MDVYNPFSLLIGSIGVPGCVVIGSSLPAMLWVSLLADSDVEPFLYSSSCN